MEIVNSNIMIIVNLNHLDKNNIYMGNCCTNNLQPPSTYIVPSIAQYRMKLITNNFEVYKELSKMLDDVVYT